MQQACWHAGAAQLALCGGGVAPTHQWVGGGGGAGVVWDPHPFQWCQQSIKWTRAGAPGFSATEIGLSAEIHPPSPMPADVQDIPAPVHECTPCLVYAVARRNRALGWCSSSYNTTVQSWITFSHFSNLRLHCARFNLQSRGNIPVPSNGVVAALSPADEGATTGLLSGTGVCAMKAEREGGLKRSGVDPPLCSSRACLPTAFIAFSVPFVCDWPLNVAKSAALYASD